MHINLSVSEILRLADSIIAKSRKVHDAVASVPLDKVILIHLNGVVYLSIVIYLLLLMRRNTSPHCVAFS